MSDPVSNAEIEDVLSSIRRLVSIDQRAKDHSVETRGAEGRGDENQAGPAATTAPDDAAPDTASDTAPVTARDQRLVLTPSFRVDADASRVETTDANSTPDADTKDSDHLTLGRWQVAPDADKPEEASDDRADYDWLAVDTVEFKDDALGGGFADDDAGGETAEPQDDTQLKEWLEAEAQDARADDAAWDSLDEEADAAFDYAPESAEDQDNAREQDSAEDTPVTSALEARIAEVEAAVAARDDQWEPDGASEDAYAGGRTDPLPWEDHVEADAPDDTTDADPDGAEDMPEEADEEAAEDIASEPEMAAPDIETEAEPEPEMADAAPEMPEPAPEIEDEAPMAEDVAPVEDAPRQDRTVTRFSLAAAAAAAETGPAAQAEEAAEDAQAAAPQGAEGKTAQDSWYREDGDAILDEDALRDLVSEIVRQELQGSLGERITRNVRKLVRREIHRAMMGQDLD